MIKRQIKKTGNSHMLRFDKSIMDAMNLSLNDWVSIKVINDTLIIKKELHNGD